MLTIRQARPSDCENICRVHRAAILQTCVAAYGEDAARKWAGLLRPESYPPVIASRFLVVAEDAGSLLGFGQFDSNTGEVEAIYVDPPAEKRGIGSALMVIIEEQARANGHATLRLRATTNAEHFYVRAGFVATGADQYALSDDMKLPCIKMEKILHYTEPRPERRRNGNGGGQQVDLDGSADA